MTALPETEDVQRQLRSVLTTESAKVNEIAIKHGSLLPQRRIRLEFSARTLKLRERSYDHSVLTNLLSIIVGALTLQQVNSTAKTSATVT